MIKDVSGTLSHPKASLKLAQTKWAITHEKNAINGFWGVAQAAIYLTLPLFLF